MNNEQNRNNQEIAITTIAVKSNIIAYDSRCRQGDTIVSDDDDKHLKLNGIDFFFSGNVCDQQHIIDLYFGNETSVEYSKMSINAFAVESGIVYMIGISEKDGFWKCPVRFPESLGSGSDHALTAMDMGATAKEAVKWAMRRDSGTGGRIRMFKVKK